MCALLWLFCFLISGYITWVIWKKAAVAFLLFLNTSRESFEKSTTAVLIVLGFGYPIWLAAKISSCVHSSIICESRISPESTGYYKIPANLPVMHKNAHVCAPNASRVYDYSNNMFCSDDWSWSQDGSEHHKLFFYNNQSYHPHGAKWALYCLNLPEGITSIEFLLIKVLVLIKYILKI